MTIATPEPLRRKRSRGSFSKQRLTGLFWQIVVVGIAIAVVAWLWSNAIHNLSVRRISTGFAFLGREAGMPIADAWLAYSPKNTYLRAFMVGIVNTLRVAVLGIVLATVLGTMIGIARLSSNWLLSRLAAVYVEVLRDLPLLLQLLFWYVLMQGLPAARAAWMPIDGVYLSNRGLVLPSIPIGEGHLWVIGTAVVGLIALYALRRRLIARQLLDGQPRRLWPYALVLLVGIPTLVSWSLGVILDRHHARAAGLQFCRRIDVDAGVLRATGGARHLYLGLHRRDRTQRHTGRSQGRNGMPPWRSACAGASCFSRSSCRRRFASSFRP